jgi:uncharacterized membrane protein
VFTARYELNLYILFIFTSGFSIRVMAPAVSRRTLTAVARGSIPSQYFVLNKLALGQVSLPILRFSSAVIIPPMLRNLHLHVAATRRTSGRSLETFTTLFRVSLTTGEKVL